MHTELLDYADDKQICEAFVAYDETKKEKRPAVLICHAWGGQGAFEQEKAKNWPSSVMLALPSTIMARVNAAAQWKRMAN